MQEVQREFDPWIGKIPWSRKWQLAPVFLPENVIGRGGWPATVPGSAKHQTELSVQHTQFFFRFPPPVRLLCDTPRGEHCATYSRSLLIIYFICACMHAQSLSRVRLFAAPGTVACQPSLSVGILQARILEWVAICSSRDIFLTQGWNTHLLHWQPASLPLSTCKAPILYVVMSVC